MKKYYTGIGSRQTPDSILNVMKRIARYLSETDHVLRSGGAIGADTAFERGSFNSDIYRAHDATDEAIELASAIHPAWNRCNDYARKLHGRNVMLVLGPDLKTPSKFVICWTKGGEIAGGTGLGIKLAQRNNIPVFNLYHPKDLNRIESKLEII